MSASHEITIWCDGCMKWEQRSGITATKARKGLALIGWLVGVRGVTLGLADYCSEACRARAVEGAGDG